MMTGRRSVRLKGSNPAVFPGSKLATFAGSRRGFTLAEMIMAIALLAFFSVFIVRMFAKANELTLKARILDQAVLASSDLADQWKRPTSEDTLPVIADLQHNLSDGRLEKLAFDQEFRLTEQQQARYLVCLALDEGEVDGLWELTITLSDQKDGLNTPVYALQASRYFPTGDAP